MQYLKPLAILSIVFLSLTSVDLFSQIADDFSDGDLTSNPTWQGDQSNFVVNTAGALQLNAPGAGNSTLFVQGNIPDSAIWQMDVRLEFAPSSSNRLRIYLMADRSDLLQAKGYFLEIGENGSADAIRFFRQDSSAGNTLLLAGTPGFVANDPVDIQLAVRRTAAGLWFIEAAPSNGSFQSEGAVADASYGGGQSQFFGFHCLYTATRADKFFFDNISILPWLPDTEAPVLLSAEVISSTELRVQFNEVLEDDSALDPFNYSIAGVGEPFSVTFFGSDKRELRLELLAPLNTGDYVLQTDQIADTTGNVSGLQEVNFQYIKIEQPEPFDVVINEVLFNPETGGSDFVELYNRSDKIFDWQYFALTNYPDETDTTFIKLQRYFYPGEYVVFSPKKSDIESRFPQVQTDFLFELTLPTMPDDAGSISVFWSKDGTSVKIDSFDYQDDFHNALYSSSDQNGVSLERIRADGPTNDPANWTSAARASGGSGTPTLPNSQQLNPQLGPDLVTIDPPRLSPDGDGYEDFLNIQFAAPGPGYAATMTIFDSQGVPVKRLARQELIGTEGALRWDGDMDDGTLARPGIYILFLEIFSPDGDVRQEKKPFALVQRF